MEREEEFLKTLNYPQRVVRSPCILSYRTQFSNYLYYKVLVSSCLLLATKVEESLCKISVILNALKVILGQAGFLNAIPANTNQKKGSHIEVDEAMAWPLRIQETIILEVLGFDVEVCVFIPM